VRQIARAQPVEERLTGVLSEVADEAPGEVAGRRLPGLVRLQDFDERGERVLAGRGQLLRRRRAFGGRVGRKPRGCPRDPGRIAAPQRGSVAHRDQRLADHRVAVADGSLQHREVGRGKRFAEVGEQFGAAIAGVADRLQQPAEGSDRHVGHFHRCGTDRGLEQSRRRVAGCRRE